MDERRVDLVLEVTRNIFWTPSVIQRDWASRIEQRHCARPRLYWYNSQY